MSFLLMFLGTALIYPKSGAKGLFDIFFGTIVRSFFVVRVKKGILRAVTLSINKAFYQAYIDFLAILDYKTPIRAGSL